MKCKLGIESIIEGKGKEGKWDDRVGCEEGDHDDGGEEVFDEW